MKDDRRDEIAIGPEVAPGIRAGLKRTADGEVTPMHFTPARDGVPVPPGAEVLFVDPVSDGTSSSCECGTWRKVSSLYPPLAGQATSQGPAQVATPEYLENYDRIFGKKPEVGLA